MKLTGLHILLTYQCTHTCDHCFAWGSPRQRGVFTPGKLRNVLKQAKALGTIERIAFEGGEPFLHYPILLSGVRAAARLGFPVGIVTNCFWATSVENAITWLRPLIKAVDKLQISSDLFHAGAMLSPEAQHAQAAAEKLSTVSALLSCARPNAVDDVAAGGGGVAYRGRAAEKLSAQVPGHPWQEFTACGGENLREPGRIHLDPLGNLHICQGITIGNIFRTPLAEIIANYDADAHPIAGPLLAGGPAELVRRYNLPHADNYADACHLCYSMRQALRERFPESLGPDQMYGIME